MRFVTPLLAAAALLAAALIPALSGADATPSASSGADASTPGGDASGEPSGAPGSPGARVEPAAPAAPVTRLTGGAGSLDELLQRFVAALGANDREGLEALRVSEAEYRDLIVPGHVAPGAPPQVVGAEAGDYFFDVMNTKSAYHRDALRKRFAGKTLEIREFHFEKGVQQYAGHRAHKRLALTVVDQDGKSDEIRTGSVVERDGRFKLMSFVRD